MKVILYMAITANGYIAKENGDSDFTSEADGKSFEQKCKDAGCIVIGRKTFDQYNGEIYPMKNILNIIITSNKLNIKEEDNVIFAESPKKALEIAQEKGFGKVLIVGGGELNASFMKESLVDEIYLDVEPVIFGKGIPLFRPEDFEYKLELLEVNKLSKETIQLHYKVIK